MRELRDSGDYRPAPLHGALNLAGWRQRFQRSQEGAAQAAKHSVPLAVFWYECFDDMNSTLKLNRMLDFAAMTPRMHKQRGKAIIAVKGLPQGMIAEPQSSERSAPALAIATNSATNLITVCLPDERTTKKVGTLNLEVWFSTPNIVDIDEMLIRI
jgi:hypothetical protein